MTRRRQGGLARHVGTALASRGDVLVFTLVMTVIGVTGAAVKDEDVGLAAIVSSIFAFLLGATLHLIFKRHAQR